MTRHLPGHVPSPGDVPDGRRPPEDAVMTPGAATRPMQLPLTANREIVAGMPTNRRYSMAGNSAVATRAAAPDPTPAPVPPAAHVAPRGARRRARRLGIPAILLTADLAAFVGATLLTAHAGFKIFGVLILVVWLFALAGLYRPRLSLSVLDDAPTILGRALAAGALAMVLGGLSDGVAGITRLVTCALFGALCVPARVLSYGLIRTVRRHGHFQQRMLLLGAGTVGGALAGNLLTHQEYGLLPVGVLDDDPLLKEHERPVPLLGGYGDLSNVVLEQSVDVVIVTYGSLRESLLVPLLRACDRLACEILFVPRLYEVHTVTRETEVLWGTPLLRMRRAAFRSGGWSAKRVSDVILSAIVLLLIAPVMGICALLSWAETGCVLFRQTRVGLDGRPFTLLKFCSMRPEEDSEASTTWSIASDARVGRVGRFLRRTSFDELPQLWNVLRGDMSLVGPRPERPHFVDEFTREYPRYMARHRVPAGLTGWAQVHGLRGDTSIADRARFDNFYIENWSLWGDVKILLRTAGQVLKATGR